MPRHGVSALVMLACSLFSVLVVHPADAVMFTLRPGSVLARKPTYKAADRLEIKAIDVLVEGPSLDQQNDFCLYRLFDRQAKPLRPEQVWIPCHSIDTLFLGP